EGTPNPTKSKRNARRPARGARGRAGAPLDAAAEVGAEEREVGAVDEAVAVEVERRVEIRVRGLRAEGGAEQGEVGAVDEAVAVDVPEEAVQLVARRRAAVG